MSRCRSVCFVSSTLWKETLHDTATSTDDRGYAIEGDLGKDSEMILAHFGSIFSHGVPGSGKSPRKLKWKPGNPEDHTHPEYRVLPTRIHNHCVINPDEVFGRDRATINCHGLAKMDRLRLGWGFLIGIGI